MKKMVFALLLFTVYCNHQNPAGIQQDQSRGEFADSKTIVSGTYNYFQIGDPAEKCYSNLQSMYKKDSSMGLMVVSNAFENTSNLLEIIPLYNSAYCESKLGGPFGVQVAFKQNQVSSIYLNNGEQLSVWPLECESLSCIRVGDDVNNAASDIVAHADELIKVRLHEKNLAMPIDPNMINNSEWYYTELNKPDTITVIHLYFVNSILNKIEVKQHKLPHGLY
jgi:hypothetical protein